MHRRQVLARFIGLDGAVAPGVVARRHRQTMANGLRTLE